MNDKYPCEIVEMNLPVVYGVINANAELIKANTRWVETFESKLPMWPECQPCGQATRDFIFEHMDEASKKGESNFEICASKLDGSTICIAVNLKHEADGTFIACAHDITNYKTTLENALKREQKLLETNIESDKKALDLAKRFLDAAPIFIETWDNEMNFTGTNQVAVKMFGLRDTDHYIEVFDKLHPEFQPCGMRSTEKMLKIIEEIMENGYAEGEWMHVDLEGNPIPVQSCYVRFDVGDDEYRIVGYSQDLRPIRAAMSEMENAIDKLRASEERSINLLDASPIASFSFDTALKTVDCNFAAVTLFAKEPGVHPSVTYPNHPKLVECLHDKCVQFQSCERKLCPLRLLLIENYLDIFMAGHEASDTIKIKIEELLNEVVQTGTKKVEWVLKTLYGMHIPCEITIVSVNYDGNQGFAFYIRDLREEKLRAMAEDANKAKSTFLSTISHEIRTPLNAIIGITQIRLQKNSLSIEDTEAYQKIYSSGSTLLGIINGVLDFSKIETGNLELMPVEYDVPNLINDSVQLNFVQLESKPIEFFLDIDENLPSTLFGDDLRIKQILNNLLSNSVKYTQSGHIKFSIKSASKGETCELKFIIEDTGQGIKSEDLSKLFSAYARFNLEENRTVEGTGIGLKITEELIKMMGGSINVESTVGVGSTFYATILQKTTGSKPIGKKLAKELESMSFTGSKVRALVTYESMPYGSALIVDDVESNLYVAEGLLAPYNITIDIVDSGFGALEKVESGKVYDVIFMDHMMPKMDGVQTTKKLREMGYDGTIIALTANALKGSDVFFLSNGFDWFISKPIDVRQLDSAMTRFIRDKHFELAGRSETAAPAAKINKKKNEVRPRLLKAVLRDVDKAINALKDFQKSRDMELLILTAHSMKMALLNINEQDLSDTAGSLEEAGYAGNLEYINDCIRTFTLELEKLLRELS